MTDLETSFQLLSTMSPKVNKAKLIKKSNKSPRKLALKKNFRKSALFDRKDHSLILDSSVITVDETSLESDSNSDDNPKTTESPIVIYDSSDLESYSDTDKKTEDKLRINIDNWLSQNEKVNGSNRYSFENVPSNFKEEEKDSPEQKTMNKSDDSDTGFDNKSESQESKSDDFIDDSLVELDEGSENILDDLYGKSWRDNKYDLLTLSEPRHVKKNYPINATQTERKLKKPQDLKYDPSIRRNIFHLSHISKKQNAQSNWWNDRLKSLCDSDTEESDTSEQGNDNHSFKNITNKGTKTLQLNSIDNIACTENNKDALNVGPRKISDKKLEENSTEKIETNKVQSVLKSPVIKLNSLEDIEGSDDSLETRIRKKIFKKTADKATSRARAKILDETPKKREKTKTEKTRTLECNNKDNKMGDKDTAVHGSLRHKLKYSFLKSLSGCTPSQFCDDQAKFYKDNYKTHKAELAKKLFELYNERVFENALPADTQLEWNNRMRGTAGYCYNKRRTDRFGVTLRTSRIVLATKILDSADRLRDTLIHEMCHAATWVINHVSDGHGPFWKSWAYRALQTFPELPPIKRCHDYVINTKYTYKCTGCGYSIGRHSKSLNVDSAHCGYCYGRFQVFVNKVTRQGEQRTLPATPAKLSGFALFVKQNYGATRTPDMDHKKVMKALGQQFSAIKVARTERHA